MITANDLKNMDYFLGQQERLNPPKEHKGMLKYLRKLIATELNKFKIKTKK